MVTIYNAEGAAYSEAQMRLLLALVCGSGTAEAWPGMPKGSQCFTASAVGATAHSLVASEGFRVNSQPIRMLREYQFLLAKKETLQREVSRGSVISGLVADLEAAELGYSASEGHALQIAYQSALELVKSLKRQLLEMGL